MIDIETIKPMFINKTNVLYICVGCLDTSLSSYNPSYMPLDTKYVKYLCNSCIIDNTEINIVLRRLNVHEYFDISENKIGEENIL